MVDPSGKYAEIAKQHNALRDRAARIEALVSAPEADAPGARKAIFQALVDFHSALKDHFRLEENEGYLEPVMDVRPDLERRVEALRGEHQVFLDGFERLARVASATAPAELRLELREALARLAQHERAEALLIQRALEEDLGGG